VVVVEVFKLMIVASTVVRNGSAEFRLDSIKDRVRRMDRWKQRSLGLCGRGWTRMLAPRTVSGRYWADDRNFPRS
jgi:hypothetical protein